MTLIVLCSFIINHCFGTKFLNELVKNDNWHVNAERLCMTRAIIAQMIHHPHMYTLGMAMRQVALDMLRHPHKYYKFAEVELFETGESSMNPIITTCSTAMFCGNDLILAVFGDMFGDIVSLVFPISPHTNVQCIFNRKSCLKVFQNWLRLVALLDLPTSFPKAGSARLVNQSQLYI